MFFPLVKKNGQTCRWASLEQVCEGDKIWSPGLTWKWPQKGLRGPERTIESIRIKASRRFSLQGLSPLLLGFGGLARCVLVLTYSFKCRRILEVRGDMYPPFGAVSVLRGGGYFIVTPMKCVRAQLKIRTPGSKPASLGARYAGKMCTCLNL